MAEHGIQEDQPGIHPSVLSMYYGTEGEVISRQPGQTGAGHAESDDELESRIADDQTPDIRHEAVEVPSHRCPFAGNSDLESLFHASLKEIQLYNIIPTGYGVDEHDLEDYPVREEIRLGRGGKVISVILPTAIWWPRAVQWAQGLDLMTRLIIDEGNS